MGLLGGLFVAMLTYPSLGEWAIFPAALANALMGFLAARLMLRLDPPELAD